MTEKLDPEVIESCTNMVEAGIGNLDDLPRDVASTVVQVYYRAASVGPPAPGRDLMQGIGDFAQIVTGAESVAGFIEDLREMRKSSGDKALYDYAVQLFLDIFKYRIPEAHAKSGLRRAIERKLSTHVAPEIPGLLELVECRIGASGDQHTKRGRHSVGMQYEFDEDDWLFLQAASTFLKKIAACETTKPVQLVSIAKLQHVLSVLPQVTSGVEVSVSVSGPRRKFDDIETWHWWKVAVEDDRLNIGTGGHFYRPSTGGDSFTTMSWTAVPEEPAELDDYRDTLWIVPDVQAFSDGVEGIDLASSGYTLEIVDSDNPLLEEAENAEDEDLE